MVGTYYETSPFAVFIAVFLFPPIFLLNLSETV